VQLWGLHVLDLGIVVTYVIVMFWIGVRVARAATNLDDFFLAGRKLGKGYQFFLNFGCATNPDQAVAVSREVYRQGIGGMWIQSLVLFLTPFYWFTVLFLRRVRLTTIGDFFTERFGSRFLGTSYAIFMLILALLGGGVGYMVAGKTMCAMTPKPLEECTAVERASVEEFRELRQLETVLAADRTAEQAARFDVLKEKEKHKELRSFVSHIHPIVFYILYALVMAAYTMLGGFRAAAVTDVIQGFLIVIFSVLLIPIGLSRVGGFAGLHASVPEFMFQLFGSASLSDYAWYTVLAMVLANLVSIIAVASGMQTAGSAVNEFTARVGIITGMFAKRIIMIFWALAGLIAVSIYAGRVHDPDLIWGVMSRDFLSPGLIGFMLVGILAATMSSKAAGAVAYAALFIRNLYRPWRGGRSDAHYLRVSRAVIAVTLFGGVVVALFIDNLLELFQYVISIPAIFGAAIWLGFIWRRITRWAVILQVIFCLLLFAVVPNLFPRIEAIAHNPRLLAETAPRSALLVRPASPADVEAGRATEVGRSISVPQTMPPVGIYFDRVARIDPADPSSPKVGLGRFNGELWFLSWFGASFERASKAQLMAVRFFVDALLPLLLLLILSFVTPRVPRERVDRFFAKMHTPVQRTPEEEERALALAYANPGQFEPKKIVPGSSWEIMKPARSDYVGFLGCWVLVGVIIFLFWGMVRIR
jgi:solute:Na+ symporter, SSS family